MSERVCAWLVCLFADEHSFNALLARSQIECISSWMNGFGGSRSLSDRLQLQKVFSHQFKWADRPHYLNLHLDRHDYEICSSAIRMLKEPRNHSFSNLWHITRVTQSQSWSIPWWWALCRKRQIIHKSQEATMYNIWRTMHTQVNNALIRLNIQISIQILPIYCRNKKKEEWKKKQSRNKCRTNLKWFFKYDNFLLSKQYDNFQFDT